MLKAILASFIGTFLALAAIGLAGLFVADRITDRIVADLSERIDARLAAMREQVSSAAGRIEERAGRATQTLAGAAERRAATAALLAALGACVEARANEAEKPATVVRHCLEEHAPGEP